ncbi:uncharacterized protein rbpms isoform X4 [Cyprinus carpio]|uniref:RRM domain-containing protein n=2 Tax=Cyprinus carpio TaxID=7962 RepID=A0A9J8D9Z6_CYPCA|nr:uncharacterized protein rbpms isoform X4 [Cyprinus carpio]
MSPTARKKSHFSCQDSVCQWFAAGELYLLFRPFQGYKGSLIKFTSKQPVGFVSFDSRSEAEAAKNALNVSLTLHLNVTLLKKDQRLLVW